MMGQMGIGPIPLSEIKAYLDLIEVTDLDEKERWVKMIRALDGVYVEHVNETLKKERAKAAKAAKSGPPPSRPRRRR